MGLGRNKNFVEPNQGELDFLSKVKGKHIKSDPEQFIGNPSEKLFRHIFSFNMTFPGNLLTVICNNFFQGLLDLFGK